MSKYQTGLTTKKNILAACRELFYEKGFEATTFVDICRAAQVNQGSIHYHFKNKDNILREIYDESIRKNNACTQSVAPPGTLMYTKYFFGGELYLYKMEKDSRFLRFNIDAARLADPANMDEFIISQTKILYFDEKAAAAPTPAEYFEAMASLAFDSMLRQYLYMNTFKLGYHEISELSIEIYRRILQIDDATLETVRIQLAEMECSFPWERLDTTLDPDRIYAV